MHILPLFIKCDMYSKVKLKKMSVHECKFQTLKHMDFWVMQGLKVSVLPSLNLCNSNCKPMCYNNSSI